MFLFLFKYEGGTKVGVYRSLNNSLNFWHLIKSGGGIKTMIFDNNLGIRFLLPHFKLF